MPTTVGALCGASALSSASFVVRRIVLPTLRPCCSASSVLMATSPEAVGRRPLLSVVNRLRVGTSCALTAMWVALRSCLGRSRTRTLQWRPRTEATPSRAEIFLTRESSRGPSVLFARRPSCTTTLASPTDRRAPVCIWVRAESEMMKAKAMRAALMATATRAAAVRRRSSSEGISGPPSGESGRWWGRAPDRKPELHRKRGRGPRRDAHRARRSERLRRPGRRGRRPGGARPRPR